jgi:hypothetical protein
MDRKALIREYKNNPPEMGVYQIKNRLNGKVLIGTSKNLTGILNRFRTELKLGGCRNIDLQKEWNSFGSEAFEFEVLEVLEHMDDPVYDAAKDLKVLETLWLEKLTPYGIKGYNKK